MAASPDAVILPATHAHHLLAVATRAAAGRDREALAAAACAGACAALRAHWAVMCRIDADGRLVAVTGSDVVSRGTVVADAAEVADSGLAAATGPVRISAGRLGGSLDATTIDPDRADAGVLVVAGRPAPAEPPLLDAEDQSFLVQLARLLGSAFERIRVDGEIALNEQRLAEAQELAQLGSYDWHIPTDTNTWSDELYRIYGHEPGAFNASYERFLSMIHPEDRERIIAIHTKAMQDFQPYRMEERIVRPDGEVRYLDSTGKVVLNEHGQPLRMVGICLDVTEQRRAAQALRRSEERFRTLVESAPDAVILYDETGRILMANRETERLFGWTAEDLLGAGVGDLLPDDARAQRRPAHDTTARHRNGTSVPVDVSVARIETDDGPANAAFVRDATERLRAAEVRQRLEQAEERRRQALEINDNVVQGLTGVVGALEMGWLEEAASSARATLASASAMMSELLGMAAQELLPGELIRDRGVPVLHDTPRGAAPSAPRPAGADQPLTVLLADDSRDLRSLYRLMLHREGIDVVAEAADGVEAVRLALEHRPDVALVDLAMPGMDGLQVTEAIKAALPECRVVMLSGFEEVKVGAQARAAGVDRYVAKGVDAATLSGVLFEVGPPRAHLPSEPPPPDPVDELLHELRTPLAVIGGIAATLGAQLEVMSPQEAQELLGMVSRNVDHVGSLLRAYGDLQRLHAGRLELEREPVELSTAVRAVVADLAPGLEGHAVAVDTEGMPVVDADPVRLRQILTNLLSNAAKFAPSGTPLLVGARTLGDVAEVRVSDHGPGIPAELRARLFRPFERLGAPGKGAGLGLHISQRLAEAMGGELRLDPDAALTTFVLRLPLA